MKLFRQRRFRGEIRSGSQIPGQDRRGEQKSRHEYGQGKSRMLLIIAHRGAPDLAPEGTAASFEAALMSGASLLEVDVRQSADGVLYNLHDPFLGRTTNGTGYIGFRSSRYLDSLDAGSWFSPRFAGEGIPKVKYLLERFGRRAGFFFDVKKGVRLGSLVSIVEEYGVQGKSFFWLKGQRREKEFRKRFPGLTMKINVQSEEEVHRAANRFRPCLVECSLKIYKAEIGRAVSEREIPLILACHGAEGYVLRHPERWAADYWNFHHLIPELG